MLFSRDGKWVFKKFVGIVQFELFDLIAVELHRQVSIEHALKAQYMARE